MSIPRNLSRLAEGTDASGVLGIAYGGTGGNTAATARTSLGLHAVAASGSYADLINAPIIPTSFDRIVSGTKSATLSTAGVLTVPGSIIPDANISYDLGSATYKFRDLYLSGNTIYLGTSSVSVDPGTGTLAVGANNIATETYVNTAVSNLVASAPATLDTLNELATALGNDANFSTTISTALGNRVRVDTAAQNLTTTQQSNARTNLGLATVANTGSYTDLSNTPTLFSGSYTDLTNKPTLFSGSYTDLTNKPTLFSGAYTDLTGAPTSITAFGITDGTNGQVLTTNGTGTFTFTTPAVALTETDIRKVYASVRNVNGSTITKGQVVYLYGATGDNPTVKLADADADLSSATTLGVVYDTSIANGEIGLIITQGLIVGVDTSAFTAGDILYLSSTAGGLTNVKPHAPVHSVFIGVAVKINANSGEIYVKPQNGYELEELHNVDLITTPPTNGQVLTYNSSTSLWTATTPFDGTYASLSGKPNLSTVATTGSYNDLTDKPSSLVDPTDIAISMAIALG